MVGAVCGLCDGREGAVVGDCGAGYSERCCESCKGTGVWQCCDGGLGSRGDESVEEEQDAADVQQEEEVDPTV